MPLTDIENARWELLMREDTRLAADEKARCRRCQAVLPMSEMLLITVHGNVLFASCPEHVRRVTLTGEGNGVRVEYEEPRGLVLAGAALAGPLSRPNPEGAKKPAGPVVTEKPLFVKEST